MNIDFCFKTPRQACEALDELLKDDHNLTKRPWDRFRPDFSAWWLVPSTSLPHFKHSKYFFRWGDTQQKSILCGYYVEKGLDELVSQVYSSKKAKNLIMSSDWAWNNFIQTLNDYSFIDKIKSFPTELPQIEIIIDGGYVAEPTSFDPYQDKSLGWDIYNFLCTPGSDLLTLGEIKRKAFVLKMHNIKTLKDLVSSITQMSKDEWLWLNFLVALRVNVNVNQRTEKTIAMEQAKLLWENFLKHFAKFII